MVNLPVIIFLRSGVFVVALYFCLMGLFSHPTGLVPKIDCKTQFLVSEVFVSCYCPKSTESFEHRFHGSRWAAVGYDLIQELFHQLAKLERHHW